ncbi:MAG: DUF1761 domain-containing protein [Candidatus Liptonbacteria bacterium]|nr:DUF1761 domain-containing protein [Candidatus Liptonbacteria bacterium]
MVPINYLAVLVAAIASMVLGFLWYEQLFGKYWMQLMGFTSESMAEAKKKGMTMQYSLMTVGSLVMSYVLANAVIFGSAYLGATGITAGIMAGFWNWLGFIAPVTLGSVIWEGNSWKLWVLNNGYYLVSLSVMGTILSVWK